jgi:hypothetical protein
MDRLYWVHQDGAADLARIHRADCGYVERLAPPTKSKDHESRNTWSGPFHTFFEAKEFALSTGHKYVGPCKRCLHHNRLHRRHETPPLCTSGFALDFILEIMGI